MIVVECILSTFNQWLPVLKVFSAGSTFYYLCKWIGTGNNLAKYNLLAKYQGAFMKTEKTNYQCPLTSVVNIGTEGLICISKTMLFGTEDNTSGVINDENIIDGGSF